MRKTAKDSELSWRTLPKDAPQAAPMSSTGTVPLTRGLKVGEVLAFAFEASLLVGPAITWTLRLPWEGESPADREQPPALAFHVLSRATAGTGDGHRLTTHFRVVP
jgi:hypothetical protein